MKKLFSILFLLVASMHLAFAVGYSYNQQSGGMDVCWQYDDMCGVLTESNTEVIHWVVDGGSNTCELSAYGWALTPNSQYYAYYPYSRLNNIDKNPMTALPVSYTGQSQAGNNNAAHLNAFDYMTAQALSGEDQCHFDFKHLGCILRIECEMQEKLTLKTLTISLSRNDFAAEATMDVVNGTLTPTTSASTLPLDLSDVTIEAGEKFVAFMMLPPTNLTARVMNVTLITTDGMSAKAEVKGTEMQPGCLYPMSLKMPKFRKTLVSYASLVRDVDSDLNFNLNFNLNLNSVKAKSQIINRVTAFAPAFVTDEAHVFEQMNIPQDDVSGILSQSQGQSRSQSQYTLSGVKTTSSEKGTIVIRNGKKYIK